MVSGKLYLRPSADISVGHSLYPSTSAEACLLINEEVCDGDSTYIYFTSEDGGTTSRFAMTIQKQPKITAIKSGIIAISPTYHDAYGNDIGSDDLTIYINGTAYTTYKSICHYSTELIKDYTEQRFNLTDEVSALQSYLSTNGSLPSIELEIYTFAAVNEGAKTATTGKHRVGQVYIELDCEYEYEIYKKESGEWKPAHTVYQKQSGSWVEITLNELKNILQNSFITGR